MNNWVPVRIESKLAHEDGIDTVVVHAVEIYPPFMDHGPLIGNVLVERPAGKYDGHKLEIMPANMVFLQDERG